MIKTFTFIRTRSLFSFILLLNFLKWFIKIHFFITYYCPLYPNHWGEIYNSFLTSKCDWKDFSSLISIKQNNKNWYKFDVELNWTMSISFQNLTPASLTPPFLLSQAQPYRTGFPEHAVLFYCSSTHLFLCIKCHSLPCPHLCVASNFSKMHPISLLNRAFPDFPIENWLGSYPIPKMPIKHFLHG